MDDVDFQQYVSRELANLPSVEAVMLGGSRACGGNVEGSDWDFAVYYRDRFRTDDLRGLGWSGVVSEIGGWGGGVMNGGAWLSIEGRRESAGRLHQVPGGFGLAGLDRMFA